MRTATVRSVSACGYRESGPKPQVADSKDFAPIRLPARSLILTRAWTGRAHPSNDCRISVPRFAPGKTAGTTHGRRAFATTRKATTAPDAVRSIRASSAWVAAGPSAKTPSRSTTTASGPSCCGLSPQAWSRDRLTCRWWPWYIRWCCNARWYSSWSCNPCFIYFCWR